MPEFNRMSAPFCKFHLEFYYALRFISQITALKSRQSLVSVHGWVEKRVMEAIYANCVDALRSMA